MGNLPIIRVMFTCGWCGTHYQSWKNQCQSCGGPMPPPPGMDAGPEPPPAPRRLPEGFALRVRLTGNLPIIMGLIISFVGGFLTLALVGAKSWLALFPGFFLVVGLSLTWHGVTSASRVLDAFRNGRAIKGRIASVRTDTTTKVNGQHPWEIVYSFQAEGHPYEGKVTTFEAAAANRFYGSPPVWVLVVEGVPERNTLYPPVK